MSGAMENRAAVFTKSAQDVEVYRARAWEPGSMLGWRHAPDGSCQAWVRLAAGGAEDAVWIDLADVRLPEPPSLRSVEDTVVGVGSRGGIPLPRSGSVPEASRSVDVTATMTLVAVRDGGGERRGEPSAVRAGGRRRAPEIEEKDSSDAYWAALDASVARAPELPTAPGRHRAPAPGAFGAAAFGAGRHRAADTAMLPTVAADEPVRDIAPRTVAAPVVAVPAPSVDEEPDAHLYTRPLRLAPAASSRAAGRGAAGGF